MEISNNFLPSEFSSDRFREAPSEGPKELGQEYYLRLMVAQIENQDPFQPMANGEFIAELAQFGTVSGINELKGTVEQLGASLLSNATLSAASLLGKSVLVGGNSFKLGAEGGATGFVESDSFGGTAKVEIFNSFGEPVRELSVDLTEAGANAFEWDGLNDAGEPVEEGVYSFRATLQVGEEELALATQVKNLISSVNVVNTNSNATELGLENGELVSLQDVEQIFQ